jgi:hypothetical protein
MCYSSNNTDLLIKISLTLKYDDYVQIYYSDRPSQFYPQKQIKIIVKSGQLQVIEFEVPYEDNFPYLRIDLGNAPSNFISIEKIELSYDKVKKTLTPPEIYSYFNFNGRAKITEKAVESLSINSIKVNDKYGPSMSLRFEKVSNILYELNQIDTTYLSQIEVNVQMPSKNFILVYYDSNTENIPDYSYSNSVRLKSGMNKIYTNELIRNMRLSFHGNDDDTVAISNMSFLSDIANITLNGSELLNKYNLSGSKTSPSLSANLLSFILGNEPSYLYLKRPIESSSEIFYRILKFSAIFSISLITMFSFNKFWSKKLLESPHIITS